MNIKTNVAIKRKGPSRPVKLIYPFLNGDVLDYGCGYAADVKYLRDRGHRCEGWDPHSNPTEELLLRQYTDVLLTYVLCIIPNKESRNWAIIQAWNCVRPGGSLYVTTRTDKEIAKLATNWTPYQDGYITKANTFQKGWETEELAKTLEKYTLDHRLVSLVKESPFLTIRVLK